MIKLGLMGCGTVAGYGHLPAICETSGISLHALFDPSRANLDTAGEKFSVPRERRFTDVNAFFVTKLDAVSITSPAPFHCANVLAAAAHKCHVLCEKPIAESDADGQRMIDAMKAADRRFVVGFIYRFSPMARKVREVIQSGGIGQVRSLRFSYIWDCHGKYSRGVASSVVHPSEQRDAQGRQLNLRRDRFMKEGGPMIDCGVHEIDLARWWACADVKTYASHGTRIDDDYPVPDHIYIHITHNNGVHSMVESSFSYGHTAKDQQVHYRFEAIGTDGVICFNHDKHEFFLAQPTGTTQFEFNPGKNFHDMYAQFKTLIETGDLGTFATAEDAMIATRIARDATGNRLARSIAGDRRGQEIEVRSSSASSGSKPVCRSTRTNQGHKRRKAQT